jgi:hypothetical protein
MGALGATLLVWEALPLRWEGLVHRGTVAWVTLLVSALLFGGVGGTVEGVALRESNRWLAWLLMGIAAVPALALAVFALGLWLPDVHQLPLDSRRLGVSLTGWLLFVVVLTLTALATAGRRGRRGSGGARGGS